MAKNPILKRLAFESKYLDKNWNAICYWIITYKTSLMRITNIEIKIPAMSPRSTSKNITDKNVTIHAVCEQLIHYLIVLWTDSLINNSEQKIVWHELELLEYSALQLKRSSAELNSAQAYLLFFTTNYEWLTASSFDTNQIFLKSPICRNIAFSAIIIIHERVLYDWRIGYHY